MSLGDLACIKAIVFHSLYIVLYSLCFFSFLSVSRCVPLHYHFLQYCVRSKAFWNWTEAHLLLLALMLLLLLLNVHFQIYVNSLLDIRRERKYEYGIHTNIHSPGVLQLMWKHLYTCVYLLHATSIKCENHQSSAGTIRF